MIDRRELLKLGLAAGAAVAARKSFFFFDRISLPRNSLREPTFRVDPLTGRLTILDENITLPELLTAVNEKYGDDYRLAVTVTDKASVALPVTYGEGGLVAMALGLDLARYELAATSTSRASGRTTRMLCEAVAKASQNRFVRLRGHSYRYSCELAKQAREMGRKCNLSEDQIDMIAPAQMLHDSPLSTAVVLEDHHTLEQHYGLAGGPPRWISAEEAGYVDWSRKIRENANIQRALKLG